MKKIILFGISLLSSWQVIQAQEALTENRYASAANPLYWKNRMPFPGYWQQDVHYMIDADIDETTNIISGSEKLVYTNNSPDKLTKVYFHLYSNAQTKDSYLDKVYQAQHVYTKFGKYASEGLGCYVEEIKMNGKSLQAVTDNTILIVQLDEPIPAGASVTFDIKFKTYFETNGIRNRMKLFNSSGFTHYDGVHWYPRMSVYDRKFGWTADQHFDREFYGDFGTYDVQLHFANDYIVDATGNLLNESEVLPADIRKKLDISNFKDKPLGSKPSTIIPRDGTRKTWKFHAENVHDFAFTADPTYRIAERQWQGIRVIALAQESNASKWQNAADYTAKIIETYSKNIGMYAWPKIIVADARDGMEYPMLTLDGGTDPGYRGLLAHEVGHQWFFGMVGNNETYRASLDEGFTQFLTILAQTTIDGPYDVVEPSSSAYVNKFREIRPNMDARGLTNYLRDAGSFREPSGLNTHSDYFGLAIRQGGGYGEVYYKTASMLFNLQYVLGDDLFWSAMQHYFNQWKFCHPYFEDFRNSIIQFTGVDLNWFFDQWLETTKTLDYSINTIKRTNFNNVNSKTYEITFERKGEMQSPIDFQVTDTKGKKYNYYIPNTYFQKKTDAIILPKWTGWEILNKKYTATISLDHELKSLRIDTSYRLADIYQPDNSLKTYFLGHYCNDQVVSRFDSKIAIPLDRRNYRIFTRPDLWYNNYDGMKFGIHQEGNYMNTYHIYSLSMWYNSGLGAEKYYKRNLDSVPFINFNLTYKTSLSKYIPQTNFLFGLKYLEGLGGMNIGFEKTDRNNNRYYVNFKGMRRYSVLALNYLIYQNESSFNKYNNTINLGIEHSYNYSSGKGSVALNLKTSAFSDFDYSTLQFTELNTHRIGKFDLKTRAFIQIAYYTNVASESALFLAGANPEEMADNKYTRSNIVEAYPKTSYGFGTTTTQFQYGGGLNLRGYCGYLAPHLTSEGIYLLYKGMNGAALNTELEFDRLFPFHPSITRNWLRINAYFFGDAGSIAYQNTKGISVYSAIRADAGIGFAFTIKKFGPLQTVNPLTVRLDFPLYLSDRPYSDAKNLQYRSIIGINRAF